MTFFSHNYVFLSRELRDVSCELQVARYKLKIDETTTL